MEELQIIHDLALIHAREKYRELFEAVSPGNRGFLDCLAMDELMNFYSVAFDYLSEHYSETSDTDTDK